MKLWNQLMDTQLYILETSPPVHLKIKKPTGVI